MIELRTLGLSIVNATMGRIAEVSEDSGELEQSLSILETCKQLIMNPRLRLALTQTADSHDDRIRRECDVQRSLMEAETVRNL